jgi:hypothetical protein
MTVYFSKEFRLRYVEFIARRSFLPILALCLLTTLPGKLVGGSVPSKGGATFDFFRIVEKHDTDKSAHLDAVRIHDRGRTYVVYTERDAVFRIPATEVISITIEREHIRGMGEHDYLHKATFSLQRSERLGRVQFVGRFGGTSESANEFSTFLEIKDVQRAFAPLKEKVIWK